MSGPSRRRGPRAETEPRMANIRWIRAGPRLLTSLRSVDHNTGNPDAIRAFVRSVVADGADVIKILATASVRDGGAPTMSFEQVFAACDEARKLKRRSAVHAHTRRHHQRGPRTPTRAGDHEPDRVCCRSGRVRDRHALGAAPLPCGSTPSTTVRRCTRSSGVSPQNRAETFPGPFGTRSRDGSSR